MSDTAQITEDQIAIIIGMVPPNVELTGWWRKWHYTFINGNETVLKSEKISILGDTIPKYSMIFFVQS